MIAIERGFREEERDVLAGLYWQAFGTKLQFAMGPEAKALRYIARVADPDHAFVARDDTGRMIGAAGFKTAQGALVGGGYADLRAVYGWPSAFLRAIFAGLLERDTENKRFLVDGIFVAAEARGRGAGTALIEHLVDEARARGYDQLRLDVVDTNDRARALYERLGFQTVGEQSIGLLRLVFGFRKSIKMVLDL